MFHAILSTIGPEWLYHPLGLCVGHHAEVIKCKSYNAWSGSFSDISEITILTGLAIGAYRYKKTHECHVESPKNCRRHGRPVAGTGHRACRKHHPHAAERGSGITVEDILQHHEESKA